MTIFLFKELTAFKSAVIAMFEVLLNYLGNESYMSIDIESFEVQGAI